MWTLSSSSDPLALSIVDGTGRFASHGPHYSRRTPGSKTFTGVGQEIVLARPDAVWAVVRQKTPARRGSGTSRGRTGSPDASARYVWRNMLFRKFGPELGSTLIQSATELTYWHWLNRYGGLPSERLRTEVDIRHGSRNPGYCYLMAGWERGPLRRHKRLFYAPRL